MGLPGAFGVGLAGIERPGSEYRNMAPSGNLHLLNNVSNEYLVLGVNVAAGFELQRSAFRRGGMTLGNAFEQLGFVGPLSSSAMVNDYALRGTFGLDYNVNHVQHDSRDYYQSRMDFQFTDGVRFTDPISQTPLTTISASTSRKPSESELPTAAIGSDLLIAADVYYKLWDDAGPLARCDGEPVGVAVGTQLTRGKIKYRLGYSYNSNPINHSVGESLDGFPVAQEQIQLFQAACVAFVNQHRITGGIGYQGFIVPTLDLDLFAGGLFNASDQFGSNTQTSLAVSILAWG